MYYDLGVICPTEISVSSVDYDILDRWTHVILWRDKF